MAELEQVAVDAATSAKEDKLSQSSLPKLIGFSIAIGAIVYVGFAVYTGAAQVRAELAHYVAWTALASCALALGNYMLRFVRWQIYMRALRIEIPLSESLAIFVSGFALTVTPGKLGEVVKSVYLRQRHQVPLTRSAPTVVAERLTDLIAAVFLCISGASAIGMGVKLVFAAALLCAVLIGIISSRALSLRCIDLIGIFPVGKRIAPRLHELYEATAVLLKVGPLIAATLLAVGAWGCECVGFYLIINGFSDAHATLFLCIFIYTFTTIAGAVSFLPGGIGVQEGGMITLLAKFGRGIGSSTGAAATFITRLTTLWFAVAIGAIALLYLQRTPVKKR